MTITNGQSGGRPARHFISLRTKLVAFISLIIIVICSALSAYFIQQRAGVMNNALINTGTILAKNLAYNSRHLLFIEDLEGMGKLIDGVMEVEEVGYVIITGPEGKISVTKRKGNLSPDPIFAKAVLESALNEPRITLFSMSEDQQQEIPVPRGMAGRNAMPATAGSLYDVAVPVMRRGLQEPVLPPFSFESPEPPSAAKVYGVVQIGMTRAKMLAELNTLIVKAALITVLIILCGITLTTVLAGRIITPLKSLARVANRIAEGDLTASVEPKTHDEVGQLTEVFNHMTGSLKERDVAISRAYQQLEQLTQTLEQRVRERTQELEAANERLRELDELKSSFVSIVSHELRTPMTSIKGYVDNILDGLTGVLTDQQSYYLNRVKYNVERLTRMINELLDHSNIEAGRVELRLGTVCMRDLVTDVVEGFQRAAAEKGIALHTNFSGELPAIQGDRDKLHQILTNLIQNAIKFTQKGGQVRVESQVRADGYLQISVSDTGSGIPPHELDRVFEKLYRGESVPTEDRGCGLGLTIAKSYVEKHRGLIWVESTLGQGSRFYFTVPVQLPSR
jgi:signal transduction histidine kinase